MLRNCLAAALRNLVRNRLYAAINVIGLTVGFAAAMLIALFVRDELNYDRWLPEHDRAFLVTATILAPDRAPQMTDTLPSDFAGAIKQDFPAVAAAARLFAEAVTLRRGEIEVREKIYWADPDFFNVIPLPVVAGDAAAALRRPDGIVMTRSMARKYFGREDVVGERIEINRTQAMTIAAVLEDLPSNTHLDTQIIASGLGAFSALGRFDARPDTRGFQLSSFTYLKFRAATAARETEAAMPAFLARHRSGVTGDSSDGFRIALHFVGLADIHLSPGNFRPMKPRGNAGVLVAVSAAGLLIAFLACVNFINLMTARGARRAVEVGVRKTSGAERRHLIVQFIGESAIYMAFGAIAALIVAHMLLQAFNAFLDRGSIAFDFSRHLGQAGGAIVALAAVAILAGAYPAFVISAFPPSVALKAPRLRTPRAAAIRQALVMLQFAVLVGLILISGVIYRQIQFATGEAMRLSTDQVLEVFDSCGGAFADRVKALPGVRATACSSAHALNIKELTLGGTRAGISQPSLTVAFVDEDFFGFFGLHPLAGRFFSPDMKSDRASDPNAPYEAPVVLNETAARTLGFNALQSAVGGTVTIGKSAGAAPIIGVTPDFAFDSIRAPVVATAYLVHPRNFEMLHLKLDGNHIPETLDAIDRLWREAGDVGANVRPINRFFLDQRVQSQYADLTRQAQIFGIFGSVAVFIACLGLFGLSVFTAEQRIKEIGIRKAMGASRTNILWLLTWQFAKPVLWANIIAWPVSYLVMRRWLNGFAYHIDLQPWIFLAASALAAGIAVLTVIGHALLVSRSEPIAALRYE